MPMALPAYIETGEEDDWTSETIRRAEISFGLEMQQPWSQHLLKGEKTIEVRSYPLPAQMINEKIYILETKEGTNGVSTLGDHISFTEAHTNDSSRSCKIVGWCKFKSVKEYTNREQFEADENFHLVSPNSGYAWKDGATKVLYGWVVGETILEPMENKFTTAVRRKRSLFQLFGAALYGNRV